MTWRSVRRRFRNKRRFMPVWDGLSIGIIAILAGVTLFVVSLAMRRG